MRALAIAPVIVLAGLACAVPTRVTGGSAPMATPGFATVAPTASIAPTRTEAPPSPTPTPPRITADTVANLSVVRTFGEGIVRSVALSPDGSVLAAAEGDPAASIGTIKLYDPATGVSLGTLEGHESGVWGLAFSPDGRYLASAGRDLTAKIWDWRSGALERSLDFPNEVVSVAFSPDSRILAVGGVDEPPGGQLEDAAIWTFTVDDWQPQHKLAEYWNIADIVFTPDGSLVIGGGISRNVRVWSANDGVERFVLYHPHQVGSLAVSPDGSTLASALCEALEAGQCLRGAIWLWDLRSGRRSGTISDIPMDARQVAYSPDGSLLIVASPDGTLRAYATLDLTLLQTASAPPGPFNVLIGDMALSADGRSIATGGSGRIDIWEVGE